MNTLFRPLSFLAISFSNKTKRNFWWKSHLCSSLETQSDAWLYGNMQFGDRIKIQWKRSGRISFCCIELTAISFAYLNVIIRPEFNVMFSFISHVLQTDKNRNRKIYTHKHTHTHVRIKATTHSHASMQLQQQNIYITPAIFMMMIIVWSVVFCWFSDSIFRFLSFWLEWVWKQIAYIAT